ncbi:hypothetical protein QE429_003873 [Bacillus sp. SORGH_AS 510]|uniref:hypothetical protein n=1 Tax=Bacillus sp. SORGH_AS_0510 TaxID=3041771 RepID=UPI00278A002D|nr:hypothetical protein [Bacillus sp. SORGH_AS_0510]MDQ1147046.1 hypothetical protein [Bacillus sp. SORGH_AS_0510]
MKKINPVFETYYKYKDKSIDSLIALLCSMVEKAENEYTETSERKSLLKDIDELHAHTLLVLGMHHHTLQMLAANHPEVYKEVYEVGDHIKSLV